MPESQKLIKRKIIGREFDIAATQRINDTITTEKTEITKKYDGTTTKVPYDEMDKSELEQYKQDLTCRLMVFESESAEIRTQIKIISNIQREKYVQV